MIAKDIKDGVTDIDKIFRDFQRDINTAKAENVQQIKDKYKKNTFK
jgi:hypothetical protein